MLSRYAPFTPLAASSDKQRGGRFASWPHLCACAASQNSVLLGNDAIAFASSSRRSETRSGSTTVVAPSPVRRTEKAGACRRMYASMSSPFSRSAPSAATNDDSCKSLKPTTLHSALVMPLLASRMPLISRARNFSTMADKPLSRSHWRTTEVVIRVKYVDGVVLTNRATPSSSFRRSSTSSMPISTKSASESSVSRAPCTPLRANLLRTAASFTSISTSQSATVAALQLEKSA
mmetsp:Transcript_53206/g.130376  ORF Transcript_53206/g.130376 Transcript_53206/m.130376 type:complete len:234 (-) Transcript_53206:1128-1829(-)